MTTDITELAQSLKAAAEKATQGEWWADEVKNEGCYGSGDDCVEGFTSYAIYGSDGQTLFDSLNSDAACICEEYDGEGHVAWDETAQRNAEFIALANPVNVLALVEALEKAQQRIAELDIKNCELDSLTQRWAVERAENADRIAELELSTVPGKWIPVSERMPDVGVKVLCFPAEDEPIHAVFNGQLWLQDVSWSGSDDPIDNVIPVPVTHWMSLPPAPQEVKGE